MNRQYLCETTLAGLRPLGVGGRRVQESWHEIDAAIRTSLGDTHARLFAEPIIGESGIAWFAEAEGAATPYSALPPDERATLLAEVEARLQPLRGRVEQLKADSSPASRRLGETLERALSVPSPGEGREFLYAVRTGEGAALEPVLVNWGTRDDLPEPPLGVLQDFLRGEALRLRTPPPPPPGPVVTPPSPLPPIPGTASVATMPPPVMLVAAESAFPWWIPLWLLFALLVGTILYLLLTACGIRGPFGVLRTFCEAEAAPVSGLRQARERGSELEQLLADLEVQTASLPRCDGLNPRGTGSARNEIERLNRRVEAAGGSVGEVALTLSWDGDADLDLRVVCPDGAVVFFQNRTAPGCGSARLDVDANASQVRPGPIENVTWGESAPPGHYRVEVHNYKGRSAGDQPVPFRLRVKQGNQERILEGSATPGQPPVVMQELDVQ
jgi:hypothetical protein